MIPVRSWTPEEIAAAEARYFASCIRHRCYCVLASKPAVTMGDVFDPPRLAIGGEFGGTVTFTDSKGKSLTLPYHNRRELDRLRRRHRTKSFRVVPNAKPETDASTIPEGSFVNSLKETEHAAA